MYRLQLMKEVRKDLDRIKSNLVQSLIIHYSCESFLNIQDGRTPRITSIAIQNVKTSQTESFSIHKIAESKGYDYQTIPEKYDELEKEMLDDFFDYIKNRSDCMYIHWNMRDINYGFSAIEHRYSALQGTAHRIVDSNKFDLANALTILYGKNYIGHNEFGRMFSLIKKNEITDRQILNGKEEAEAFDNKQYIELHQSTLRKVNCISDILYRVLDDSLIISLRNKADHKYTNK